MKKGKVSIEDVKEYCKKMQKTAHSNFQKESDDNAEGRGMYSLGGSGAYRDVLDFINKTPPHD